MNTLIKTVTAACVALVLASFLGASAQTGYQFKTVEWWKAGKGFIGGEQSASSAYSAGAVCTPPRQQPSKKMSRSGGTGHASVFVSARITR
jgi:hypothetical protein